MEQQLIALSPMILIFVIFYFLMIRPQRKRDKQRKLMLANLKKGNKVITIGGLHGSVVDLNDKKVTLKVSDNVRLVFERASINSVVEKEKVIEKEKEKEDK